MKFLLVFFLAIPALAQQKILATPTCSDGATGAKEIRCAVLLTEAGTHYHFLLKADGTGFIRPQDVKSDKIPVTGSIVNSGGNLYTVSAKSSATSGGVIVIQFKVQYFPPQKQVGKILAWDMHVRSGTIQTVAK